MKIECTPQELKELIENKKTPVAGTTDVHGNNKIISNIPLKNQLFGQQIWIQKAYECFWNL